MPVLYTPHLGVYPLTCGKSVCMRTEQRSRDRSGVPVEEWTAGEFDFLFPSETCAIIAIMTKPKGSKDAISVDDSALVATGAGMSLPPVIKKLDFSDFHPLDHNLLECRGYPGGRRLHIHYFWTFKHANWLRRNTLCRIGVHDEAMPWYRSQGRGNPSELSGYHCNSCWEKMEAPSE